MTRRKTDKSFFGITLAVAVFTAVFMLTGNPNAQVQESPGETFPAPGNPAVALQVGNYDPQAAFEQYPGQKKLMETINALQSELREAEAAGDQQKLMQLQQQFQQERNQTIERFQRDVVEAIPEAAKAAGVKVVAVEFVYIAEDVETKDITPYLAKILATE